MEEKEKKEEVKKKWVEDPNWVKLGGVINIRQVGFFVFLLPAFTLEYAGWIFCFVFGFFVLDFLSWNMNSKSPSKKQKVHFLEVGFLNLEY